MICISFVHVFYLFFYIFFRKLHAFLTILLYNMIKFGPEIGSKE